MEELALYKKIMNHLPAGTGQAEAQLERHQTLMISRIDGRDSGGEFADLRELYVRASGEDSGSMGTVYTQKLDEAPQQVLERACAGGRFSGTGCRKLNEGDGFFRHYEEELYTDTDRMRDCIRAIEKEISARQLPLLNQEIQLRRNIDTAEIVNSKGLDRRSERLFYEVSVAASAEHNGLVSTEFEVSSENLQQFSPKAAADLLEKRIRENLPRTDFTGGEKECVLDASVVCNIFITAWRIFSGKACAERSSVLAGRLGELLFSPMIHICDLAESAYTGYGYDIDCEGTICADTELVKEGRLCALMHNLESAENAGETSTGNAGRKPMISGVVQTDIVVVPKNFTLMPGETPMEAMIAGMKDGVFVNQSFDVFHSINLASGDFSIPCEVIPVKDGVKVGKAEGVTMEGNLIDLLCDVIGVGAGMETFAMPIIKSFAVACPALHISKIKFSS